MVGVEPAIHHASNHIALGEDADQALAFQHQGDADIVGGHDLYRFSHGRPALHHEEKPGPHDLAQRLHRQPSCGYRV
jgi:hypothetical protein